MGTPTQSPSPPRPATATEKTACSTTFPIGGVKATAPRQILNVGVTLDRVRFIVGETVERVELVLSFLSAAGRGDRDAGRLCNEERFRRRLPVGLIVAPGRDTLDLLRAWVQAGVPDAVREAILTRTGWYWVDGQYQFAHGAV